MITKHVSEKIQYEFISFFRIKLAALHYNENAGRPIARNKEGKEEYSIKFPKSKKGGYTISKVLTNCTYG